MAASTELAMERRVITVDLQRHGRTADIDRPLRYETMADDIAALIRDLAGGSGGSGPADVLGYSLGGGTALRPAAVISFLDAGTLVPPPMGMPG
jgi:pimeloyl-ACP methyl ester carboxylesterase